MFSFFLLLLCFIVFLCSAFIPWLLYSSWHSVLPLHFHFIQMSMLIQLSKVVYKFIEFIIYLCFDGSNILFLRYFSADMGVNFCLFNLVIVHAILSLLFCRFIPCGLLFHAQLQLHTSTGSFLLIVLLKLIL